MLLIAFRQIRASLKDDELLFTAAATSDEPDYY
jgi:hypothetical protein